MTSGQKTAVSILTTVVIFACFTVAAFAGLFSKIEAMFYEPAKIADIRKQLDSVAEYSDIYINTLLEQFDTGENAYLSDRSVASYALSFPSDGDVLQRARRTASLFAEASGLVGIRLVDANGRSVHFSTYPSDILRQTDSMRMYKNYDELHTPLGNDEFAFFKVAVPDSDVDRYRIVFDGEENRILFAFPFYDPYDVYRGTMIFYVNVQDFNRSLIAHNLTTVASTSDLISDGTGSVGGFVFGMPAIGRDDIEREAIARWRNNSPGPDKIASIPGSGGASKESYWILISSNRSRFIKTAGVYRDSVFLMPPAVQFLLLACVFVTLFLTIFMLFNLQRDDMVVIRDRVKRFQLALINEYFENKENINWSDVSKKIAGRKTDVSEAIKESLGKRAKRHSKETDALIDKSWDEIIGALSVKTNAPETGASEDSKEIRRMLEEILRSGVMREHDTAVREKNDFPEPKEISLARESAEDGGFFETNTEIINAATEAEEVFFENMRASESASREREGQNAPAPDRTGERTHTADAGGTAEKTPLEAHEASDAALDTDEKIDAFGEIRMGEESAAGNDFFETNTEIVKAAAETEEVFFENMSASGSAGKTSDKMSGENSDVSSGGMPPSETEEIDIGFFMEDGAGESARGTETAASAESGSPAKTDPGLSATEDVDIDSFMKTAGDVPPPEDDIFAEPLELGEPKTDSAAHEEIKPIDFDVVSAPNFLFLDEERKKDGAGESPENEDAPYGDPFSGGRKDEDAYGAPSPDGAADAEDIEPFESGKGAVPFSFTSFALNEARIQNLAPVSDDIIVEGKDGVFSIAPGIPLGSVAQDESFKRLVDSVIR